MLTVNEVQRIAAKQVDLVMMIEKTTDLPEEERNKALCMHLGVSEEVYAAILEETVQNFLHLSVELVALFNPAIVAALGSTFSLGIMMGKEMERLRHG